MQTDLRGQRFGRLTAVEPTAERKNGYVVWRCRCDCGNELLVDIRKLRRGTVEDCGCNSVKGRTDLRGRRFGKLVVVSQTDRVGDAGHYWLCRCDCGGTVEAPSRQLLSGYRKSCGCLSKPKLKELAGRPFGDLTVLSYAGKRGGSHYWLCRCSCGRELEVRQSNLLGGHSTSCGCKRDITGNVQFVCGTSVEKIRSEAIPKTNSSGVRGVHWSRRQSRWIAQITFQGKKKHLGSFMTLKEAAEARREAEEQLFGEFLKWYDSREKTEEVEGKPEALIGKPGDVSM